MHKTSMAPALITFDIFGTVLDWRGGLFAACAQAGRVLTEEEFDRVIDVQGRIEQGPFLPYAAIVAASLVDALGMAEGAAETVASTIGQWPFHRDAGTLRALMDLAPCAAMTNSDIAHGIALQDRLGFALADWLCAEEIRIYKPDPAFWHAMGERRGITPGPHWWHVSAYADYDLAVAATLGLTTVFVSRPHARPGPATHAVADLPGLHRLLSGA